MSRIKDKVKEIKVYLEEFSEIIPESFNEYIKSNLLKAGCERYAEKIIEAMTDLAFLIIKEKKLKLPEDDVHAFRILYENKIINERLYCNLKNAKGMRNILAHQYGRIDDEVVFESFEELIKDVKEFIKIAGRI
jgi:uncharacterized protein YutE (UPF0331/DUF86 family)